VAAAVKHFASVIQALAGQVDQLDSESEERKTLLQQLDAVIRMAKVMLGEDDLKMTFTEELDPEGEQNNEPEIVELKGEESLLLQAQGHTRDSSRGTSSVRGRMTRRSHTSVSTRGGLRDLSAVRSGHRSG